MKKAFLLRLFRSRDYFLFLSILISFLLFQSHSGVAQKYYTAETSYAIKLGRTKPLYDVINVAPTDKDKLKVLKANKPKYVPNFSGRRHLDFHLPTALPHGADPLFNANHLRMPLNEIIPKVNFEGISESQANSGVPDVNGDISRDYFVEIVNVTFFKVYDKTGQPISNLISANSIWSQVQQSSAGDPILLYDQEADRWFLTEFPSSNRVLLAVSVTNDPRGSWDAYVFQTPRFPDFPKYGIWHDAFYLSTNEGGSSFPIYAFNRQDLLAGAATVRFQRLTVPKNGGVFFEVGQPVDWDGMMPPPSGSPGIVVKLHDDDWGTTNYDHIQLHKIHIDWDSSALSNIELIEIPTAPFDTDGCSLENTGGFSCVPQPNSQGIDGAQWIITNKAQYRNFGTHEAFVMSFMVDVTGEDVAGIRWMEFRRTSSQDWFLYQEGTVGSDDGLHRFQSSIGIDGGGNIGLAYSISGYDKHPSLRFTGRYSTDPLGEMTFQEYEFATGAGSLNNDRFGDYASMSVDPSDDRTFWFAGEYVPTNGNWSTRVVAFSAFRDTFDIFPVSLISPKNSPHLSSSEPLTISVLNRGMNAVYGFKLGYQFNNGSWVEENALVDSLAVDSLYIHTFQTGLNFDDPGNYPIRIASISDEDRNHDNDTLSFVIRKLAFLDVALELIVEGEQTELCDDHANASILLHNMGADTIHTIVFQVQKNDVIVDTIIWSGILFPDTDDEFDFTINNLIEGENEFALTILELNGEPDEIPFNNYLNWIVTANPAGEGLFLNLFTDNFPIETTWQLLDANEFVIASGGPYTEQQHLYTVPFCLDPEECYTFIIYDAFGDGINAQGMPGDYEIVNNDGEVIASLPKPNFGLSNANQFCLTGECLLDFEVGVEHESFPGAGDGWAIAEVANAPGTVSFSIDGGVNFQTSNFFYNLSPGTYSIIAMVDAEGCMDTISFTIMTCMLETMITTVPASGGDIGEIHINSTGAMGPLSYQLNGGAFGSDPFFTMLEPGEYIVVTKDSIGCERVDTVTVSTHVSTTNIKGDHFVKIYPNPGKGVYEVTALFNSNKILIDYTIFNAEGEPILYRTLAKYDEKYRGEISLTAFPSGVYYAVFYIGHELVARRVIKTE